MSFELYIKTLQKIFNQIELEGLLDKLDDDTLKFVNKYLKDNVTLKNGKIEMNEETVKAMKRFNTVMDKFFRENENLAKYLLDSRKLIREVGKQTELFHKGQVKGFNDARIKANQDLIVNDYIDSIKGLNEEFKNPVRTAINDNLRRNRSFTQIREDLRKMIKGSGKKAGLMKRYLTVNARVAANAYGGNTSQHFYERNKTKVTHIGIVGDLLPDNRSSEQCTKAIEFYNSRIPVDEFKNDILKIAKDNGLIEGTTINNVFLNLLHWGCRHSFVPLIIR